MIEEKILFLKKIIDDYPEMKVHYMNQPTTQRWANEKIIKDLTQAELLEVNLRKQFPNEVILDVEEKWKVENIENKLKEKKWSYEIWDTGSRGVHISVLFDNLKEQDVDVRNRIRKYIIDEFNTDTKMAREGQWLAMEHSNHFKTTNLKTSMKKVTGENPINHIPQELIDYCVKELDSCPVEKIETDVDFKDFVHDPYLKYALETKIVDGGRNDVLFKNLAIGLVRSGMDREKIKEFGKIIVSNCPGKSLGEFMGWVHKALVGELKDYNKIEMVQWAIKYNHPVMYKIYSDENVNDLMNAKMLWDAIWNMKIAEQPVWRELCFYNLMGTIVDETEEDYRVHVIFSSPSRSGKDEGLNLIEDILKLMNITTSRPAEATDKTLIGWVNEFTIEKNIKYGLSEENKVVGNREWKDPREYGILKDSKWLAFGESESVFKPGIHNRRIQLLFRQAMDKRRIIEKGVGGYMIKINTNTSFALTTFSMDNEIYKLLDNGLFQRSLYYNRELTDAESKNIVRFINKVLYDQRILDNYDEKEYKEMLKNKMTQIKLWYNANKKKFRYLDDSNLYVDRKMDELYEKYSSLPELDKKIMHSLVRGNAGTIRKLAVLNATWKMKTDITRADIDECVDLVIRCIDSCKDLILKVDRYKKLENGVLNILKNGSITVGNLNKEMTIQLGIKSSATHTKLLRKLEAVGYVTRIQNGNTVNIMLTDKGKEQVEYE